MFYIYDNIRRSFLSQEFDNKDSALDYLYLIYGKYQRLTLIENDRRRIGTGFPIAMTSLGTYMSDSFVVFCVDKEKTELGGQTRWRSYNKTYVFNPKIGDLVSFYDGRKSPKTIVGFGTKVVTSYYKLIKSANSPHTSSYNIIFLKDKYGVISYITSGDIRSIVE